MASSWEKRWSPLVDSSTTRSTHRRVLGKRDGVHWKMKQLRSNYKRTIGVLLGKEMEFTGRFINNQVNPQASSWEKRWSSLVDSSTTRSTHRRLLGKRDGVHWKMKQLRSNYKRTIGVLLGKEMEFTGRFINNQVNPQASSWEKRWSSLEDETTSVELQENHRRLVGKRDGVHW